MRDAEGYSSTWFDEEAVVSESQEYYYKFAAPVANSYLYFTVESFFQIYIPDGCWEPGQFGMPLVYIQVTNRRTGEQWYQYYYESYHNPILVGPQSYQVGDTFEIGIYWQWGGSTTRDFTVKVYGLLDGNTWVLNSDGYANQMNMDGSEPSGFYVSDWRTGVTHPHPNQPLREFYFSGGDE